MNTQSFRKLILGYYGKNGRHDLPWRMTRDPYRILVSEVMLQQTQVSRVLKKYPEFLKAFPTLKALAKAKTSAVLKVWAGLGYNRRALALRRAAEIISRDFKGKFPQTSRELEGLPGIGQSTRGAIMAFAYGIPTVFIETNIRTVFIYLFFKNRQKVSDKDIFPLIEKTLDRKDPRNWYYALMDYGVHLKQTRPNPSRQSAHHAKQSPFKGSKREIRSRILAFVLRGATTKREIEKHIGKTPYTVVDIIKDLESEGFMTKNRNYYFVK